MAFFLFILVNASLFIRPAEIVPDLLGWEIYFYLILACFVVASPDVLRTVTAQSLDRQPITLCIFGVLVTILIPPLVQGNAAEAWRTSFYFAKIIVYYLLLISVITTTARLRTFLFCLLVFSGVVAALTVLRYHDILVLDTMKMVTDTSVDRYGLEDTILRLQGTGIFQDPNELCTMLAAMVPLGFYFLLTDRAPGTKSASVGLLENAICSAGTKIVLIGLLLLFAYAIYLTRSRGGFIAFVGGLGVLSYRYFGWRKTALLGVCAVPLLLVAFGGRQTDISSTSGTGHERIQMWRDWLGVFRETIPFGNGMSLRAEADPSAPPVSRGALKLLAHNSYLQSFADLGFVGGCLFLGAFLLAIWLVYRIGAHRALTVDSNLKSQEPFLLASLIAYCLGMLTLSIAFIVPTYLMLGLAVAYSQLSARAFTPALPPVRFDPVLIGRFAAAGVCYLACVYVFVRLFA